MQFLKLKNVLFFFIFLVSIFLNILNFYVIVKSGILDFPDTIKLNLEEISDFIGSIGRRLDIFEAKLMVLENKIDSNIKSPPKDIILPVLEDKTSINPPYNEEDAQFMIDFIGFSVGVVLCVFYKWWIM